MNRGLEVNLSLGEFPHERDKFSIMRTEAEELVKTCWLSDPPLDNGPFAPFSW